MKLIAFAILTSTCFSGYGQLLKNQKNMALVRKGINYIYNVQPDSAQLYIDSVAARLPVHPAVPMMKALKILWTNIPLSTKGEPFGKFTGYLQETIRMAERLDGGREQDPEAVFFEMTARGLLAEYYADDGQYMKALGEANKAYGLIKKGFELASEEPEFLLTTGVYNYFREKYPEKHPVYKPLVWFFKEGNVELGLEQIKEATEKAVLTRVEAYVYLAYIYLRYEYEPEKAQTYFAELTNLYPNNQYFQVKYFESLASTGHIKKAPLNQMKTLTESKRAYYQMAGEAFLGLYLEKVTANEKEAVAHYRQGLSAGNRIPGHGEHYRSLCYLGLGRIYAGRGDKDQARYNLDQAIDSAEKEDVEKEAERLLAQL